MKTRRRPARVAMAIGGVLFWLAVLLTGSEPVIQAAPAAAPAQAGQAQPEAAYVGRETCLACHPTVEAGLATTPHWNQAIPDSPAADMGCESCHGPGSRHLLNPADDDGIRKFTRMAPRDVTEVCLSCHTDSTRALFEGSPHDSRNLACTTCHTIHAPQAAAFQLRADSEIALCETCHPVEAAKTRRVTHMPVQEGQLTCSSCHNPHGSTNVRLLRVGNWINEACVSCHTEKRGPFLFEHAAGRESCVSCHDPHGSSNDRLLVARLPMLCQRCHIGTRHPSTIYDNRLVQDKRPQIIGRACVNCHSQIHGSNHPSGQSFTR